MSEHHKNMLKKSMIVLIGVIVLFSLQNIHHIEVSVIALGGAAVLIVITRSHFEKILHEVDWSTLVVCSLWTEHIRIHNCDDLFLNES